MNNSQGRRKCNGMLGMGYGDRRMDFAKIYHNLGNGGKAEMYRKLKH